MIPYEYLSRGFLVGAFEMVGLWFFSDLVISMVFSGASAS